MKKKNSDIGGIIALIVFALILYFLGGSLSNMLGRFF